MVRILLFFLFDSCLFRISISQKCFWELISRRFIVKDFIFSGKYFVGS